MAQTLEHQQNVTVTPITLTPFSADVDVIQKLDDEPNDVGGLTAQELKEEFDKNGNAIKTFINGTLIPEVIGADATEQARQEAENERVANEIERVSNENARVLAETGRANAETTRGQNETTRQSNETTRGQNETTRQNNETTRGNNETARANAETLRANAESNRVTAEGSRVTAEGLRVSAETGRVNAESSRVLAESGRVTAEENRVSAENARVSAENSRKVFEAFDSSKAYVEGNKVSYQGSSYYCISNAPVGILPTNTTYWLLIAQKGQDGTGSGDMSQSDYDINQTVKNAGGIPTYVGMQVQDKSDKSIVLTGTLDADNWSSNAQTLTISGLATSGYLYIISPNSSDFLKWAKFTIYADDITTSNSITFHCKTVPTDDISVTIVKIQEG